LQALASIGVLEAQLGEATVEAVAKAQELLERKQAREEVLE
jgi:hypothetical protein